MTEDHMLIQCHVRLLGYVFGRLLLPVALLLSLVSTAAAGAEAPWASTIWVLGDDATGVTSVSPVSTKGAVVVGCEGITMSGSAKIDSWNSSDGLYSPALARDNTLVATVAPNADVVITGMPRIHGDLLATRDLRISNGELFTGGLFAGRNIVFSSNPPCPQASVLAGGTITDPGAWWLVDQCGGGADWVQQAEVTLPSPECDPLDVNALVSGMATEYAPSGGVQPWPYPGWRPDPVEIDASGSYNTFTVGYSSYPLTVDATKVDYLYIDGDFNLTSGGHLHIRNPHGMSSVQELRIIVLGDFTTDGGSLLTIDPGISVRVYTTGKVTIGGGAGQDITPSIEIDGKILPTFGIYTSYASQTSAYDVRVIANSPLTAVVYAPLANVQVGESGEVFGAVRGKTVAVTGSGWIHYDENLDINSNWDGGPIFATDLSVSLAADPAAVGFNRDVTLTVGVSGSAAGVFQGVKIGLVLPSDLIYISHQAPPGTDFVDTDSDSIPDTWILDEVRAQETRLLEIVLRGPNRPDTLQAQVDAVLSEWSGSPDADPENNSSSLGVQILPSPWLTITKAASAIDLAPGGVIDYITTLMNAAAAPAHQVQIRGKIDHELALRLDTYGAGTPFRLVDGEPPSGLSLGGVEFSNDGGVSWGYVPTSGGGGAPAGYDAAITHWRISMVGVMQPRSSFQIEYQAILPRPEPTTESE